MDPGFCAANYFPPPKIANCTHSTSRVCIHINQAHRLEDSINTLSRDNWYILASVHSWHASFWGSTVLDLLKLFFGHLSSICYVLVLFCSFLLSFFPPLNSSDALALCFHCSLSWLSGLCLLGVLKNVLTLRQCVLATMVFTFQWK